MTEKTDEEEKNLKIPIIVSVILSVSIIIAILYFTIDVRTFEYLSEINIRYEFFLLAVLVNLVYWTIWGARQKVLSNSLEPNADITLKKSTKIVVANLFLANITPSMAGGEPVRIYLLNKNGLSIGSATASALSERLLDAIFLIICIPFAFLVLRRYLEQTVLRVALTVGAGVFVLGIFIFIYSIKHPDKLKSFLVYLSDKFSRFSRKREKDEKTAAERIVEEVDNFHASMMFFLSEGKKTMLKAGVLTALFWITGWIIPILILMGLGFQPFIIESCAAQVFLIIIAMIPTTPGSAGVTELGATGLYSIFLPETSLLGVFVLLFRMISYHMGTIAGVIFQYRIFKSVASFSIEKIKKKTPLSTQELEKNIDLKDK
ncbi:MAG: flippase-like domain-containing protein [Candidatus Thermoplasmatota archaeon]